jgi:hypothetical protein
LTKPASASGAVAAATSQQSRTQIERRGFNEVLTVTSGRASGWSCAIQT